MADPDPPGGEAETAQPPEPVEEKVDEVPYLIDLLVHPELNVRWRAAEALGEARDPRAVEPLITALRSGAKWLRQGSAWALGKIGDPRAVEPLVAALSDPKADVRKNAAWALGQFTGDQVVSALSGAAKDPDPGVQRAAQLALDSVQKK